MNDSMDLFDWAVEWHSQLIKLFIVTYLGFLPTHCIFVYMVFRVYFPLEPGWEMQQGTVVVSHLNTYIMCPVVWLKVYYTVY